MRVLHLYAGNLYGGVERLLVTFARLRDECPPMRPHFGICFEGRLSQELRGAGSAVSMLGEVRYRRPWTVWKARRALRELLRRERFDAVICHSCWSHALFAPVVRRAAIPLGFWAHDMPQGRHWVERLAARHAPDLVLAGSRFTAAAIPNLFRAVRTELVHCPVPAGVSIHDAAAREQVRRELGALPGTVVIIQACRMEPLKGHRLLLEALSSLRDTPGWACWIAGGPQRPFEESYLNELRSVAADTRLGPRVQFLGQRSDVGRLLAGADLHCQPNTAPETFGIAFVEALLAGLPVVTTAMGGACEIVTADCGILVPPGDVAALAEAIRSLIADPARRAALGAAGAARARQLCDPRDQMRVLHEALKSVRPAESRRG